MEVPGAWIAGGAVLALLAGVGIGWLLRGPDIAPAREVVVVHDVVDGDEGGPSSASLPSSDDPASTCPTELALLRAAYNSLEAEAIGEPETFPADLDPAYTPDGVRAAVDELVAACPELGLKRPWVDCEEYPCQVWFERSTDVGGFDSNGLSRCDAWVERMGQGGYGVSNGSLMRDGQTVRYLSYHLRQPDTDRPEWAFKRSTYRWDLNRERYAEEIGARALTDIEAAQSSVAFWERLADEADDPDRRASLEQMADRKRADLEELRNAQAD